jgi:hypothetical protein
MFIKVDNNSTYELHNPVISFNYLIKGFTVERREKLFSIMLVTISEGLSSMLVTTVKRSFPLRC